MDPAAEAALIAAVMTDPACFDDATDLVDDTSFAVRAHQSLWRAICACDLQGRPLDPVTIVDELRRSGELDDLDPHALVNQILDAAAGTNATSYAEIVADKAKLRQLLVAAREIATDATAVDADGDDVLEAAEARIFAIGNVRQGSTLRPMSESVGSVMHLIAQATAGGMLGTSTGFAGLDQMTGGLQPGQLITLAARPGMGKSSFALQIARHVAATTGDLVAFLSYEMSAEELTLRLLSSEVGVTTRALREGGLHAQLERKLAAAAANIADLGLFIDDQPPETIVSARSEMRKFARRGPVGLVVVDYLQLMAGDPRRRDDNRANEVAQISRGLKRLAREIGAPVLALSQLNRQVEQRPNKRPVLSDLRDSGAVEQDSDVVLFLYREAQYDASADPKAAELIVAKQRAGALGTVNLSFDGPTTTFKDLNPTSPMTASVPAGPTAVPGPAAGARRAPKGGGSWTDPF